ncbi:MAG: hypothetical protein ACO3D9_07095 [Ilumatobacteraceae bacterium]
MDLVDLVGMESPGDRANKAIQVVPDPVFRAAKTTRGLLVRVATTTARHVPGGMMIALGSVVMMTVRRVLVVMMTVRRVLVVMMTVQFVGVVTMLVLHVLAGMMIRRVLVVMMIVLHVLVVMTDRLAHVQLPSRRPMRFAIGVAVAA